MAVSVVAQKAYIEDEEDAKLAMNRANSAPTQQVEVQRQPVRSKKQTLLETFKGTSKQVVGDGVWQERGYATLWYDAEDQIISIEVENKNDATNL